MEKKGMIQSDPVVWSKLLCVLVIKMTLWCRFYFTWDGVDALCCKFQPVVWSCLTLCTKVDPVLLS